MGLYFSRLFLRDRYTVAPSGVKGKIKSEITPDNAGLSGTSAGLCGIQMTKPLNQVVVYRSSGIFKL